MPLIPHVKACILICFWSLTGDSGQWQMFHTAKTIIHMYLVFLITFCASQEFQKSEILEICKNLEAYLKHASSSDVCLYCSSRRAYGSLFCTEEDSSANVSLKYSLEIYWLIHFTHSSQFNNSYDQRRWVSLQISLPTWTFFNIQQNLDTRCP